jgi:putative redox protein
MVSMTAIYLGGLRTEVTHLKSGNKVVTDAPTDNNGKGEAFSPTDLTCTSLNSCMMTLMGMLAEREQIELTGLRSEIVKVMTSNPRKISEIHISFFHDDLMATDLQKEKLRRAALTCPVALSVSPEIKQIVNFNF